MSSAGPEPLPPQNAGEDALFRLRRDHLHALLLGTLWAVPVMGIFALTISAKGDFSTIEGRSAVPFLGIFLLDWLSFHLLKTPSYQKQAIYVYLSSFLVGEVLFMLYGQQEQIVIFKDSAPFLLLIVTALAGAFLSPGEAIGFTAGGLLWTVGWSLATHVHPYSLAMASLLAVAVASIAHFTAGSLYDAMAYSLQNYYRTRERAEEFWRNKEELRQALEERSWLNQELQTTNRALETSSEVGRQATSILKLDELLPKVVALIQENFGYYFVGIWLPNKMGDTLRLRAGIRLQTERAPGTTLQGLSIAVEAESIISHVFRSVEKRIVDDVLSVPDYLALDELPLTRSVLALPLLLGRHILGVLDIQARPLAAFNDDDLRVMRTLANQLSVAIRNADLYEAERHRRQLAESLEKTGRVLSRSLDPNEVPGRILAQLALVVPYKRGSVLVQESEHLRSVAQRGFPPQYEEGMLIPLREGDVFSQIVMQRKPLLIPDTTQDERFKQIAGLEVHHSWAGIPLISKDRVIGMISLTRKPVNAFAPDDVLIVQAFAGQAAIALENAHLHGELAQANEQLEQRVRERTAELNRAYHALEQMDKNKSDFIRVAAHELRTPLTVIKGYTQILRAKFSTPQDASLQPVLNGILSGTTRLHTIINSMLDVAMIDTQTMNMVVRPMKLPPVLHKVIAGFESALHKRHLSLTLEGIEGLPEFQADESLLYKVFDHLIGNAIKYTPDGGQITVRGETLLENGRETLHLSVCDTGIGIDPQYHELIFEKFYQMGEVQVHSSSRTNFKGGGPGLGLAIAKGIVVAHHGRIWVESSGHDEETCPGSCFHILLPVTQPE